MLKLSKVQQEILDHFKGREWLTTAEVASHFKKKSIWASRPLRELEDRGYLTSTVEVRGLGRPKKIYNLAGGD